MVEIRFVDKPHRSYVFGVDNQGTSDVGTLDYYGEGDWMFESSRLPLTLSELEQIVAKMRELNNNAD